MDYYCPINYFDLKDERKTRKGIILFTLVNLAITAGGFIIVGEKDKNVKQEQKYSPEDNYR